MATITGTAGNDTLNGSSLQDFIYGGSGGNDAIYGGGGDDYLYSVGGVDTIDGGAGTDHWSGDYSASSANLTLTQASSGSWTLSNGTTLTNVEVVSLDGGSGNDVFNIKSLASDAWGPDGWFDGGGGSNTLNVNFGSDAVTSIYSYVSGTFSIDEISKGGQGGANFNTFNVTAGSANDTFNLQAGPGHKFHVNGGGGVNYASVDLSADTANISFALSLAANTVSTFNGDGSSLENISVLDLKTGSGNDTLTGGNAGDTLDGGSGNNALYGGGGDDYLLSYGGADTINGGVGALDTWIGDYSASSANLTFNELGGGSWSMSNGTKISGVEYIELTTGSGNDTFNIKGLAQNVTAGAGGGTNTLNADLSAQTAAVSVNLGPVALGFPYDPGAEITGSGKFVSVADVQVLSATTGSGADAFYLTGGGGYLFHVNGGGGADIANVYLEDSSNISFTLNTAANAISTFVGDGSSLENIETVNIVAGAGNDTLKAAGGADTLDGGSGNNALYGGAGNDVLRSHGGVDTIDGGTGVDTWIGDYSASSANLNFHSTGAGAWTLSNGATLSNVELVNFTAGSGDDTLTGSGGADTLDGGTGTNALYGGAGDDSLTSHGGADTVDGGTGVDIWRGDYSASTAILSFTQTGAGAYTLSNGGVISNIESFVLTTGAGTDSFHIDRLQGSSIIYGGGGTNTLYLDLSADSSNITFDGSTFKDATGASLAVNDVQDMSITGGSGNDTFQVPSVGNIFDIPDYTINGGAGSDTVKIAGNEEDFTISQDPNGYTLHNWSFGTTVHISNIEQVQFWDATLTTAPSTITGTAGPDTLTGNLGPDTINGLAGDDILKGLAGNDVLYGGDGDDGLDGGVGNNALYGGAGDDSLLTVGGADTVDGGAGNNTWVDIGPDVGTTFSQVGANAWSASNGATAVNVQLVNFHGGSGNDVFNFNEAAGAVYIFGGAGDDTVNADLSAETSSVTANFDRYAAPQGSGDISVGPRGWGFEGIETFNITTGSGADTFWLAPPPGSHFHVNGGAGADYARILLTDDTDPIAFALNSAPGSVSTFSDGSSLKNIETVYVTGGSGDDTLGGGAGDDTLDGGGGVNTVTYAGAASAVTVSLAVIGYQSTGGGGVDALSDFQNLTGSGFDDHLTGDANNNVLDGGAGNDTLDGGAGSDTASYADAGGGVAVDLGIQGSAQNTGAGGSDTLISIENLTGGAYTDVLTGDGNANVLDGGAGDDSLYGGAGDDTITGGKGDDSIDGGAGTDILVLSGAQANYTISSVGGGAYAIKDNVGTDGTDHVVGIEKIQFSDALVPIAVSPIGGTAGPDSLTGTAGDDAINGLGGDDTLIGLGGDDSLSGGTGDDTLDGGAGDDTLDGGTGTNTASYADATSAVTVSLLLEGSAQATGGAGADTLSNIQNLIGSAFDDHLTGDANNNVLDGGAGNDTLDGGAGTDTASYADATSKVSVNLGVQGSAQNTGGGGIDTLISIENVIGSAYGDVLYAANAGGGALYGGGGDDTIFAGAGPDTIDGGAGTANWADYYQGGITSGVTVNLNLEGSSQNTGGGGSDVLANIQNVQGSSYDDVLIGDAHNNNLQGRAGDDTLDGGGGDDVLNGGPGINTATYADATSAVTVSLLLQGSPQATGGAGSDTLVGIQNLTGSNFNDVLTGDANANVLNGGSGDDTITGGAGNDTVDGGTGTDVFVVSGPKANYTLTPLGGGAYSLTDNVGTDGTDRLTGIEKIQFSDVLFSMGINGTAGNDSIAGTSGDDVIYGLAGDDTLVGLAGDDQLYGGDGDDTLDGGAGNDTLDGGTGNNTATYASAGAGVTVSLAVATAQATGGAGSDTLVNIQNLIGSGFGDHLTGDGGNNALYGGAGPDSLNGGAGDDTLLGGAGADTLVGGGGVDTASYADATAAVTVSLAVSGAQNTLGGGTDTLTGISNLTGSNFNDSLTGSSGNNVLIGGAGADTLVGGLGADTLTGGLGADRFAFRALSDSTVATPDTITDFTHAQGDVIALAAIDANTKVSGDQAFTLTASFTHAAGQLIEVAQSGGWLVEGDVNGDGVADFAIMVDTATKLVVGDFVL
jgi:Ca2+-binding RTX toxin-like protein